MRRCEFILKCLIGIILIGWPASLFAQPDTTIKKQLTLPPQAAKEYEPFFHLLPPEEDQEPGNAVPVLLRMVYEQSRFMENVYPKLHEFAEMDTADPRFKDFYFQRFAEQIIRAGSMSFADWQYPLRSDRPYSVLLPDLQSQRQFIGRGMTAWIRLLLSDGDMDGALKCIRAQLACARHCAATPVLVCHLVGVAIANQGFDNLELAMQTGKCPNMYWALASLPPTLQELGPIVRWELWAEPTRLSEPLPAIGDEQWVQIAQEFVEVFADASSERYTEEEGAQLQSKMQQLAKQQLPEVFGFTDADIQKMSDEELIMRWIYMKYCRLRTQVEPLTFQSPLQVIAAKNKIEAEDKALLAATGAKSSPYPIVLPQGILSCRNFERRVKFLQTIESLRDYASKHDGGFPTSLAELDLPAPNDPFTEQPFEYELNGRTARLHQAEIEGYTSALYDYELTSQK